MAQCPRAAWRTSVRQVCQSLEEAHVAGLVHRDIKPANIHLGRLGLIYDFVKVLDFGLVKPIADRHVEQSLNTQAGLLLGTPGYMAPEMALGDDVDGRADIYALGCVAYSLLTGTQVFDGTTAIDIMSKHLHASPIPPSNRGQFSIPSDLDQLYWRALRNDRRTDRRVRPNWHNDSLRSISSPGPTPRPRLGGWHKRRSRQMSAPLRSLAFRGQRRARTKLDPDEWA